MTKQYVSAGFRTTQAEPTQGYTVGVPKPKRQMVTDSWVWFKDNYDLLLKVAGIAFAVYFLMFTIVASVEDAAYEKEMRADCYASGGLYAQVGLGDDLCYKDGKVTRVYFT